MNAHPTRRADRQDLRHKAMLTLHGTVLADEAAIATLRFFFEF